MRVSYYQEQDHKSVTCMHHHLEDVASDFGGLMSGPIQEYLTCSKGEASSHKVPLFDTEVLTEWVDWIPNIWHTRGHFNQYM